MRLLSILAVLVVLGLMSQPASANCVGHETTASAPTPETVAEMPAPTSDESTTKKTTTTTPSGG